MSTETLPAAYNLPDAKIAEMREQYMPLVIQSPDDKAGAAKVHAARMVVKRTRIDIEKTRKALKEDALRYGQAVDAEAKRIVAALAPIEDHLEAQEQAIAAELKRRADEVERKRREKMEARMAALAACESRLLPMQVEMMTDEQFDAELASASAAYRATVAERERLDRIEAERREAERAELEAERSAMELKRAELEAERERLAKEREEAAERARVEQAERDRVLAEERAKVEAEREKIAASERIRVAAEEAREQERQRIAAVERERVAREQAEAAERARAEAARPIVEKIEAYASAVLAVAVPDVPQRAALTAIVCDAAAQIRAIAGEIR